VTVLLILCGALALVLIIAGVYALVEPYGMAHVYGVPIEGASAAGFVRAAGIRDLAFGAALGAAAYFRDEPLLIILAAAGLLLSLADFAIAYHAGGRQLRLAHGFHASGIIAFVLVLTMILFAFGR
jgi:hypothetical protein